MRRVACYPVLVEGAGTPLWRVALGPTVVWHGTEEPVSLFGRPPECPELR